MTQDEVKLQDSKQKPIPSPQPSTQRPSPNQHTPTAKGDDWDRLAAEYKSLTAGPGTKAINVLLERVNSILPFAQATSILDNGCGPGPIISRLLELHGHEIPDTVPFLAADFSEGMLKQVEASKAEALAAGNQTWSRVETRLVDATDMQGVADGSKSHVLAGWVYFMTPDPQKCLTESLRVLQPGGLLACTAWESSEWIDLVETIKDVKPDMGMPKLPDNWKDAELLRKELEIAGFREARSERVPVTMGFEDHETLVEFLIDRLPFSATMKKGMTEEEVRRWKEAAVTKCKVTCPEAPGKLHGWSLMAIGRK